MITVNSKSTTGGNIARLMPAASRQLVTDGNNQKPSMNGPKVASQLPSSVSNGMPVPSPVNNTVISIPNVVKPEAEVKQEGTIGASIRRKPVLRISEKY